MAPSTTSVEAIPISFAKELRVADATSTTVAPTASEILRSLLDSPVTDRGLGVVDAEETGPSRRPEEPVLEQTAPLPATGRIVA